MDKVKPACGTPKYWAKIFDHAAFRRYVLRPVIKVDRVQRKLAQCHRAFKPANSETVQRLKWLCKHHGQGYVATLLHVNERSVRRWLTGRSNLSGPAATLVLLLYAFIAEPGREVRLSQIATWFGMSKPGPPVSE